MTENQKNSLPKEIHYLVEGTPDWFNEDNLKDVNSIINPENLSIQRDAMNRIMQFDESFNGCELLARLVGYLKGFNHGDLIERVIQNDNIEAKIALFQNIQNIKIDYYKKRIIKNLPISVPKVGLIVLKNWGKIPFEFYDDIVAGLPFKDIEVCKTFIEMASKIPLFRMRVNSTNISNIKETLETLSSDELKLWIESDEVSLRTNPFKEVLYELPNFPYDSEVVPDQDRIELKATKSKDKKERITALKDLMSTDFFHAMDILQTTYTYAAEEIRDILSVVNEWTESKINYLMRYKIPFEIVFDKALEVPTLRFILLRRTEINPEERIQILESLKSNDGMKKLYYSLLNENEKNSNVYLIKITNGIIDESSNKDQIVYTISESAVKKVLISSYMMRIPFNSQDIIKIIDTCIYPEKRETVKSEFLRILDEVRNELKQIGMQEPSVQDPSKDTVPKKAGSVPDSDEWTH